MNFMYHAGVGAIISEITTQTLHGDIILMAVLPDIIGTLPNFFLKFAKVLNTSNDTFINRLVYIFKYKYFLYRTDKILYRTTHSLLTLLPLAAFAYLWFPEKWVLFILSYASHIIIDIPTHSGAWATRILFPISDFHFEGKDWWLNRSRFLFMWALLFIAAGGVYLARNISFL